MVEIEPRPFPKDLGLIIQYLDGITRDTEGEKKYSVTTKEVEKTIDFILDLYLEEQE